MLVFVPAHRGYSVDALLRPSLRNPYTPLWSVWIFRAQIGFVYFYAGLAKLNADWLHGMPLKMWLERMSVPVPMEALLSGPGVAYFLSYAGPAAWNEAGHRFSWRMMLRDKHGASQFALLDPASGRARIVDPKRYVTSVQIWQLNMFPDLAQQFARWIYEREVEEGRAQVRVHAYNIVSLNGRDFAFLIDPSVDLAAVTRTLRGNNWVLPFGESMEEQARRMWGDRAGPIIETMRANAEKIAGETLPISP